MPPASASRAGGTPEASRDRSSGTFGKINHLHRSSPSMKVIEPVQRFGNCSFSNVVHGGMASPVYAVYTCPSCREDVRFEKRHFEERANHTYTDLPTQIAAWFDKDAKNRGLSDCDYLDWLCPKCELAVRTYVRKWAGGHHGDSGAELVLVMEERMK